MLLDIYTARVDPHDPVVTWVFSACTTARWAYQLALGDPAAVWAAVEEIPVAARSGV